jgi:ribosomal-protein-alanine N-acetyltransferase
MTTVLESRRLTLTPFAPAELQRLLAGDGAPSGWPDVDARPLLEAFAEASDEASSWGPWRLRLGSGDTVGDAGFKGPPDSCGDVELSYAIAPAYRRQGFATEAIEVLTRWAFAEGALRVVAEVHLSNAPSLAVLRRCGFRLDVEDEGRCWFSRARP